MMTYLTLVAMLAFTLFPLLVPAVITGVHAVLRFRTNRPARIAAYRPRVAFRRLAVRATA
jgi:hypothetical protein